MTCKCIDLHLCGDNDHTSSEAPATRSGHVRSSDKEGGGIGGDRGMSMRFRVSEEVVSVVGIGGNESIVVGLL
jgi:hypothetical protein